MNTGQMLLVAGAITLLSIVALGINQMLVTQTVTMLNAEASLNAISIAQSLLDEVQQKLYDASCYKASTPPETVKVYAASSMTAASGFGPSSTESWLVPLPDRKPFRSAARYNDVDDYHGYVRIDSTSRMSGFGVSCRVSYVSETNPDVVSGTQTFFKRITVTVLHQSMKNPIQLSDVAVYRRYF